MLLGGAYFTPTVQQRSSSVEAVCFFHGDTGHFYRTLYLELGARLAAEGIAFLAANRRGHDIVSNGAPGGPLAGYAHESVDDSRLDYAAWLDLLRERGHESMVIGGHSGGAVRAAYAQSKERYSGVVGIIPVSPGEYNHEGLIDLHADEFTNAYSWCVEQVESGSPDAYIRPGIPWGSSWTARAFIDCFNPTTGTASPSEPPIWTAQPCSCSALRSAETAPSVCRSAERRCAVSGGLTTLTSPSR